MAKSKFKKDHYLKWYESMLMMRKFEERAGQVAIPYAVVAM